MLQALLISAAHTCRHRELAGVQIEQRAMERGSMAGHVRAFQEGQRQHIEAIRARPLLSLACANIMTSSGLCARYVQTNYITFSAGRSTSIPSYILLPPEAEYTATCVYTCVACLHTAPTASMYSIVSPATVFSCDATQRPLDGGALLCRLALDTTAQSAAPVHDGSS